MENAVGHFETQLTLRTEGFWTDALAAVQTGFRYISTMIGFAAAIANEALRQLNVDLLLMRTLTVGLKTLNLLTRPFINAAHTAYDGIELHPKKSAVVITSLFCATMAFYHMYVRYKAIDRPYLSLTGKPVTPNTLVANRLETSSQALKHLHKEKSKKDELTVQRTVTVMNLTGNPVIDSAAQNVIQIQRDLRRLNKNRPLPKVSLLEKNMEIFLFKVSLSHLLLDMEHTLLKVIDPTKIVTVCARVQEIRHYETDTRLLADEYEELSNNSFVELQLFVFDHGLKFQETLLLNYCTPTIIYNIPEKLIVPLRAFESIINRRTVTNDIINIQNQLISYFAAEARLSYGLEERIFMDCHPIFRDLMYLGVNMNCAIDKYASYDDSLVFRRTQ